MCLPYEYILIIRDVLIGREGAPCPSNKKCNGDGKLPYPKEGFWSPLADVSDYAMPCFSEDNCPGGEGIVCFESKEALDHCLQELLPVDSPVSSIFDKASDHRSFGAKFVCGEGSFGRLCKSCTQLDTKFHVVVVAVMHISTFA